MNNRRYDGLTCSIHLGQLNPKSENNMNTKRITFALIAAAFVAAVVAVASVRFAVGVDGLFGFGAAVALIVVALTDYGFVAPRAPGK